MSELSIDEAKTHIQEDGFYIIKNADLGSRFQEMRENQRSFSFEEDTGFSFCREFVLSNPVRDIMDALNSRYILAYSGGLSPDPGRTLSFQKGGQELIMLVVQVWPKSPSSKYYRASHKKEITKVRGATRFFEVAPAELKEKGCDAEDLDMDQGGL
ncbi:hypothetical protein BHE90_016320 [Fusarium euwallaceae]|uniref:Uncharacterized protein n=1 Tax=Fusarium euwallaceae TaxID=1147111 RepID=A0A430L0N4_9HYPO|nr:hypothetical protein BHE90_016320 [Fusarium euwallaceae]